MKRIAVLVIAGLLGAGSFFAARAILREKLVGEDQRKIEACYPHYLHHLAAAKDYLEDPQFLGKYEVPGGVAYSQHNPYPGPTKRQTPITEEPMSVVKRLSANVVFLRRAVGQVDTVNVESGSTIIIQPVTRFIEERVLPGQSGEGFIVVGKIPEGKVLVINPAASRKCALALNSCWNYFWSEPSGPRELPQGESPKAIFAMDQAVNRHRNYIEETENIILAGSALSGTLAFLVVAAIGFVAFRLGKAKPPAPRIC